MSTAVRVLPVSKLPEEEREEYLRWLGEFEYDRLGLPKPDLVLWMDMPIEKTVENLRRRESDTNTTADIHEVDTEYLRACYSAAAKAARFYGWQRISCVNGSGELRSMEDIHNEVMQKIAEL